MRDSRIGTVVIWAAWSAICSAGIVYLGSNTEAYQARWPLAGAVGAVIGAVAGWAATRALSSRSGATLLGLPFGILQAIAGSYLLWGGK